MWTNSSPKLSPTVITASLGLTRDSDLNLALQCTGVIHCAAERRPDVAENVRQNFGIFSITLLADKIQGPFGNTTSSILPSARLLDN